MATSDAAQPSKRQRQGAASRQGILDAAMRLMSAKGYDGTSMSDLARESGRPPSSIYWHFSSKRGVLEAVMEREAQRFFATPPDPALLDCDDPRELIGGTLAHAGRMMTAHPEFLRLFILLLVSNDSARGDNDAVVRSVREGGRAALHKLLSLAYKPQGSAQATRIADELVDFAQGMFDGAFLAIQYNPRLSHPLLMEQMTDSIVALADGVLRAADREPVRAASSRDPAD